MWQNGHDAYLESRVTSAEPLELIRMLYQACIGAVRDSRRHLESGDIRQRSNSITKAYEILVELGSSLDLQRGGDIGPRLGQLYDYMQRRLIQANLQQSDAPLAEVLGLLATLSEAWSELAQQRQEPPQEPVAPGASGRPSWQQPLSAEPATYSAHSWSY